MKKHLLIALLFIPFLGMAQTTKPIEGFLGIKFGASKAEVIAAVKAKGGTLDKAGDDPNELSFSNAKLGQRTTEAFFVEFVDGKAYKAQFVFKTELEAKTLDYFASLVNDLSDIYGKGKLKKTFAEPYAEGDGYEIQAITLGKANYSCVWNSGDNFIETFITDKLLIVLNYYDGKLNDIVEKKEKAKQKSDM